MSHLSRVAVVVLLSAGVAFAEHEVVSYMPDGQGTIVLTNDVGPSGFVITDIATNKSQSHTVVIEEDGVQRTSLVVGADGVGPMSYHFVSGVSISPNSSLAVVLGLNAKITLSGYIPCPNPCAVLNVPAVSTIGLVVLVCGLMAAGAHLLRRRKAIA